MPEYAPSASYKASYKTVVVGAGQAGLAAAYYLAREGHDFIVLDAAAEVGASWRARWDSLRLFTPAEYAALPGLQFPAPPWHLPSKDEVADYLAQYATTFDLPVRLGVRVERLRRAPGGFSLSTSAGEIVAERVIVTTGAFQRPYVPAFAAALRGDVAQVHSSAYRNPARLPGGDVLVVGASNSGALIALELGRAGRRVWLSGRSGGAVPRRVLGRDVYWWIWEPVMRRRANVALARLAAEYKAFGGDPLIGLRPAELRPPLAPPTLARVGRTTGVCDGWPVLEDGRRLEVGCVVWCTGFRPDFGWVELPVFDGRGRPRHRRGLVPAAPGLAFVGLRFLYRLNSSLLGGVGPDAEYVVRRLGQRRRRGQARDRVQA